ncbi:MAG: exo-alpha-sialidase, partial [Solirubrobacterales bacterium]|nr:exo-alpha-sialidase [Solirubrobacterales bacterium]
TDCPASPDERRTDPWLSFAADGDLYLAGVPGQRGDVFAITSVRVERLPRGAREWGIATTADQGPAFNDKEALVADPRRPGVAFVAYTREAAAGWVARTDDGGATWTAPVRAAPGTQSRPALGLVPVVLDDGTVLVVYGDPARGRFRAVRSRDDGATWSAPRVIGGDRPLNEPGDGAGGTLRTTASNPQVGAHGRRVAVAWADVRAKAIRMVVSGDRGRTWRSRRVVTVRGTGTAKPFLPAVAVDRRGVIGVTYHLLLPGRGRRVDVWFAHSHDGGRTWRRARVLGPMSLATAPRAGSSRFLGDYTGLAATGRGFVAALVATGTLAPEGRSDVRVALLRP